MKIAITEAWPGFGIDDVEIVAKEDLNGGRIMTRW